VAAGRLDGVGPWLRMARRVPTAETVRGTEHGRWPRGAPRYDPCMYLNALEFLEEEREAWRPYEALDALTDEQLDTPIDAAHDWSGRDLMAHLVAWIEYGIEVAKELAINDESPTKAKADRDWDERTGDVINAEIQARWRAMPLDEVRRRFREDPGELRGYLTVVPEARWVKHADNLDFFLSETIEHYEDHAADLETILEAAQE
jgi:hypothetical protein